MITRILFCRQDKKRFLFDFVARILRMLPFDRESRALADKARSFTAAAKGITEAARRQQIPPIVRKPIVTWV
jgi:hypothetical protein